MKTQSMLKTKATLGLLAMVASGVAANAATINVTENITNDVTWTSDNDYVLTDIIFVEPGASLTIEAGTVIYGEAESSSGAYDPGTLVVSRGAQIFANGTADEPIIFTALGDPLDGSLGYSAFDRGLWGGVIILGAAPTNLEDATENNVVEGLTPGPLTYFGPESAPYSDGDVNDNSGVFKYVSIRHGGFNLSADNEINGLTLAGVGAGTEIHHVEVFANNDDGVEFFGGTVNLHHIVIAFCGDDAFDVDYGYTGYNQFLFCIQSPDLGDGNRGSEQDSGKDSDDDEPVAMSKFFNATLIGGGSANVDEDNDALYFRDNNGDSWFNSVITDFGGLAIDIEDLDSGADSYERFTNGDLNLKGNIFYGFGGGSTWSDLIRVSKGSNTAVTEPVLAAAMEKNNSLTNPYLYGISRVADGGLDPRPQIYTPVISDLVDYPSEMTSIEGFEAVNYKGAFNPYENTTWLDGWTKLSQDGYLVAETVFGGYPSNHKDSFIGEVGDTLVDVDQGWFYLYDAGGWFYVWSGSTEGSMYMWSHSDSAWMWTNANYTPNAWNYSSVSWVKLY